MRISDWSSDVCSSDLRVGEEYGFGVDDRGELGILPQRIDLGDVENVDRARFQAQKIGDDLHPVDQRIGIPVDMPARIILARAAQRRRTRDRAKAEIEARIEFHAAEVHEAPWLNAEVGTRPGHPKANRDTGPQT